MLLIEIALGALLINVPARALKQALCDVLPVYKTREAARDAQAQARRDDKDSRADSLDTTGWS